MNLPAFREALKVLRGATMHSDGKAFMDGVAEILEQRDLLLTTLMLIERDRDFRVRVGLALQEEVDRVIRRTNP